MTTASKVRTILLANFWKNLILYKQLARFLANTIL